MAFRPDAAAFQKPVLLTSSPIVGLSSDTDPTIGADGGVLEVGETWLHDDTGSLYYWTGSAWVAVDNSQAERLKLSLLFEIRDLLTGDDE